MDGIPLIQQADESLLTFALAILKGFPRTVIKQLKARNQKVNLAFVIRHSQKLFICCSFQINAIIYIYIYMYIYIYI